MSFIRLVFRLPSKLRRKARRSRITLMLLLVTVLCLLFTPLYIIYKPPTLVIKYLQYRWPTVLWHVPTVRKIVALTIDDTPSEYTAEILQLLKQNDATATFFVIGAQVNGRERILEDLVRSGNELGNHAMYDEPSRSLSDSVLTEQLQRVQASINAAYRAADTDEHQLYFRPGSGFFNTRMLENVTKLGYRVVLGSIYPHDPQIPYWSVNAAHILSMIRPGGIIICHDRRKWTVPMLKTVLPELKRRGYQVVTVTELLKQSKQS